MQRLVYNYVICDWKLVNKGSMACRFTFMLILQKEA